MKNINLRVRSLSCYESPLPKSPFWTLFKKEINSVFLQSKKLVLLREPSAEESFLDFVQEGVK